MNKKYGKSVIGLLLLAFLLTGCFGVDRSFRGIRNYAMLLSDNTFEEEFEFSLGTVTLSMAELALNFVDVEEPIDEILSDISSVQIGVYSKNSEVKIKPTKNELEYLTHKMKKAGWDCIVKTRSRDEMSAVFVRMNDDELNQLFVISVDNDELVIVEILGSLNRAIEYAISERGIGFDID